MNELFEEIRELVKESRQFGKSRLLREYLDEIDRKVAIEQELIARARVPQPTGDDNGNS